MLLITNRRPVVHLPLAHERAVEAREVADRFLVGEVAQALGERREAGLAADEDGRPDHLAQIEIGRLGADHMFAIQLSAQYGTGLIHEPDSSLDDRQEAVEVLESCERRARRVLGSPHPLTGKIEILLEAAREKLRTHNGG